MSSELERIRRLALEQTALLREQDEAKITEQARKDDASRSLAKVDLPLWVAAIERAMYQNPGSQSVEWAFDLYKRFFLFFDNGYTFDWLDDCRDAAPRIDLNNGLVIGSNAYLEELNSLLGQPFKVYTGSRPKDPCCELEGGGPAYSTFIIRWR